MEKRWINQMGEGEAHNLYKPCKKLDAHLCVICGEDNMVICRVLCVCGVYLKY